MTTMRWLAAGAIAAAATFAAIGAATAQGPGGPPPVSVAKPVVKPITEWDEFIGRFEAVNQVDLRARVSGYLERVHFDDGQLVKEGELLFTIDQRQYKATLDDAMAAQASAKARLDFTQGDLERAESLRRTAALSEQVLDQRRQAYLTARAEFDRTDAQLRQAQLNVEFTEIRAPFAGRVSRRLVSIGNLIAANDTVLTNIVSLDPIRFGFDVDERSYTAYVMDAARGQRPTQRDGATPVFITIDNRNAERIRGRIDFVDNRVDAQSGTVRLRALVENKDLLLTPGQFGRVRVLGSGEYRGVLLPDEAIGSDQNRRIVFVVGADNTVSMRPVRPGPRIDGYRVIRDGLDGSETVVVNGLMRVRPGVKVTPQLVELPPSRAPGFN